MGSLNPEQAAAVKNIYGPLLIFAGAGSGKTRVITHRILHMIRKGISAKSIVAVTFTNKSAKEMKERLSGMTHKKNLRGIVVSTFHSLGNRILKREIQHLPGYRVPFSILSQDDCLNILSEVYRNMKLDTAKVKEDGIVFYISLCKNSGLDPYDFAEQNWTQYPADVFKEIYEQYQRRLVQTNSLDFDDLIILPYKILKENPEVRGKYRRRYQYFLVDEFQDTNPAQYRFIKALINDENNICVVGDDDQSIYGWRGADINIILGFQKDFPGAGSVRLELNYRSHGNILKAANAVISNNSKRVSKVLKPTMEDGEKLSLLVTDSEVDEAIEVAERINRLIIRENRKPSDFAILYRTNFQSRVFEQELRKREIPLHVVGGYRFFDRREVKDIIAYLRVIANPKDEISLKRIINRPRRGVGETTIRKMNEYIMEHEDEERPDMFTVLERMMSTPGLIKGVKSDSISALNDFLELMEKYRKDFLTTKKPSRVMNNLLKDLNWEAEFMREGDEEKTIKARMLNLSEVVNMMAYFEENSREDGDDPTLFNFLARVSMLAAGNDEDSPSGRVSLLTLHLAKGLEYGVVFLTGMEEGLFPSTRSLEESVDPEASMAEERRLFYVGITRAKDKLFLSHASNRKKFGQTFTVEPSRLLEELPKDLVDIEESVNSVDDEDPENPLTELLSGLKSMRVD